MQSQIENYRTKAREFARLAAVAKSRRDARHCRKFADMYWALALGDEPMRFQPPQRRCHTSPSSERTTISRYAVGAGNGAVLIRSRDHVCPARAGNAARPRFGVSPRAFR